MPSIGLKPTWMTSSAARTARPRTVNVDSWRRNERRSAPDEVSEVQGIPTRCYARRAGRRPRAGSQGYALGAPEIMPREFGRGPSSRDQLVASKDERLGGGRQPGLLHQDVVGVERAQGEEADAGGGERGGDRRGRSPSGQARQRSERGSSPGQGPRELLGSGLPFLADRKDRDGGEPHHPLRGRPDQELLERRAPVRADDDQRGAHVGGGPDDHVRG